MEFLAQYGLFALKTFTLVIAVLILIAGIFSIGRKPRPKIEITSLNKEWDTMQQRMKKEVHGKKISKEQQLAGTTKADKKDTKNKLKKTKTEPKPNMYVLDFCGDIKASQVEQLREEITAILSVAKQDDQVTIRLESPGGSVNGYGLAAAQLQRIRDKKIHLTVCIDKVAASGGYLMACVANKIIASPFAIVGSVGVVAQIPNFHRWLKKNDIDVELLTAGEYKRTLTLFAENTEKGRKKFQEELENIHKNFRDYVIENRNQLDIEKIGTGEHWLALDAFNLKLIDKLQTSDEYLLQHMLTHNSYKISIQAKQTMINKLLKPVANLLQNPINQLLNHSNYN